LDWTVNDSRGLAVYTIFPLGSIMMWDLVSCTQLSQLIKMDAWLFLNLEKSRASEKFALKMLNAWNNNSAPEVSI